MRARDFLKQYAMLRDEEIPLFEAAMGIALVEYPDLDTGSPKEDLKSMEQSAKAKIAGAKNIDEAVSLLSAYFFRELGFKGNSEDYYNPNNSMLNHVLGKRIGIPISLSAIYLEVAWRLGLPLFGVGFPGHFLLGYMSEGLTKYIDPFERGKIVDGQAMKRILDRIFEGKVKFDPSFLEPMSRKMILVRMLNNLKIIYLQNKDLRKALEVLECLCLLNPDSPHEWREKGLLNYQLQDLDSAAKDLSRYIQLKPNADDTDKIKKTIQHIKNLIHKWQ